MATVPLRYDGIAATAFVPREPNGTWVILFRGFPVSMPYSKHHPMIHTLLDVGFSVLHPSYPGVFESEGLFNPANVRQCLLDTVAVLEKGEAKNIYDGSTFSFDCDKIVALGASYGGCSALMIAAITDVQRCAALAPVVDWNKVMEDTDQHIYEVGRALFPKTIRFADDWNDYTLLNPADHVDTLQDKDVLLVHSDDDDVVPYEQSSWLAEEIGCELITITGFGHDVKDGTPWDRVIDFLKG